MSQTPLKLTPHAVIAVVGTGYMGGGIAQTFALAGHPVFVSDASADEACRAVERLVEEGERYATAGLFPAGAGDALRQRLQPASSMEEAVTDAAYVSEAVPEQVELKHTVLRKIAEAAHQTTVISSNTSAIPISQLGEVVPRPERFLGVHWMNPSYFVPCVEVIPTEQTDRDVVGAVVDLIRSIGKVPTVVPDSPGFVANRLQFALYVEAARVVEEGLATPGQVDEVVRNSFGFRLPFFGPFTMSDIAGLDTYCGAIEVMERAHGPRFAVPALLRERVRAGHLGVKTGQGFFRHGVEDVDRLRTYRDTAYDQLSRLRSELGELHPEAADDN
jgi:3-hydroxybutyryl-CoA dehydrogenase